MVTHAWTTEMRGIRWSGGWMHSADVVPKPSAASVPTIMVGSCQQSVAYLAAHGDGWMTYPRDFVVQRRTGEQWREMVVAAAGGAGSDGAAAGGAGSDGGGGNEGGGNDGEVFKPFAQSLRIDLAENPDETASPIDFGFRIGRRRLVDHLEDLRGIGVNHVQLGLGACRRPVLEVIAELAEYVVPRFPALD